MKYSLSAAALSAFVLVSATACAQVPVEVVQAEPIVNVNPYRHGNLATAQEMVRDAYDKLSEAQAANHDQLGGHAGRAKDLLREANEELRLAAIAANHR